MECSGGATTHNWTEAVEDLVSAGELDQAISYLESTVSNIEKDLEKEEVQNENGGRSSFFIAGQLSTALQDLAKLYSDNGSSVRAVETFSRALQIKQSILGIPIEEVSISYELSETQASPSEGTSSGIAEHGCDDESSPDLQTCADDWEEIADRAAEELLPGQFVAEVSKLFVEDSEAQGKKKRGRGIFSYKKQGLYSDNQSDAPVNDDSGDDYVYHTEDPQKINLTYGTRHVLVLADIPLSTTTTDLEKVLKKFKENFVIRWVNDTTSLAVFKTPSNALEASNSIQWPFTVRVLDENDELLSSIPLKDLEPPRQRPQTSVRTAQRLIAQGTGIKLPLMFGSAELRRQEEARRNRIVSRQNMRDDAWGDDKN